MAHTRRQPESPKKWQTRYVDPHGDERSKLFDRKVDADAYAHLMEARKLRGDWIDPATYATKYIDRAVRWLASRSNLKSKTLLGTSPSCERWYCRALGPQRSTTSTPSPSKSGSLSCRQTASRRHVSGRPIRY